MEEIREKQGTKRQDGEAEEKNIFLETEHFLVFAESAEKEVVQHFAELFEKKYTKIQGDFHFSEKIMDGLKDGTGICPTEQIGRTKLCCYLCGDVPEYLRLTGKSEEDYEPWMVGYSDSAAGKICLLLPGGGQNKKETVPYDEEENVRDLRELEKIAVHELVHIIFDRQCGVMEGEAWLCEGIAILYAGQTDLRYVSGTEYPKIYELGGCCPEGETPEEFADNGGYDYAGIYVWYFIEKYGFEKFLSAYKNELNLSEFVFGNFEQEAIHAYQGNMM